MKHSLSIFLIAVAGPWNAVLPATLQTLSVYPLHPSANGRYMLDASNAPFLIIGDAPHSILANLNNADATTYLTDRGNRGFNALWIELLCDSYTFGYGNEGTPNYGRDVNGNNPFTATLAGGYYDLTTPNAAYWSHVDFIVQTAAANGLQCYLTPLDQGGWTLTALANGTTRCRQYGTFLGNRYRNSPNVIWNLGNDFQYWVPGLDDATLAIADGIRSQDSKVLTVEFDFPASQSQDDPPWVSRINVNSVYSYLPAYDETYVAWNAGTIMPVLFAEGPYEDESGYGGYTGTPNTLRREEYWSLTSGALAGHMWGSYWIDRFDPAWQSHLNSQGTIELGYFKSFMTALHWYDLVPDQTHSLITAGYGTYTSTGTPGSSNYATGAKTADGTLAVIYTPVAHTMTVAMGNFGGPVTARWFDPTNATFQTVAGSPFPNSGSHNFTTPGNNSAGDPDWVLLLQAASGSPTPTPTPTSTPTPTPAVTTDPATNVASFSATLNGSLNPRGSTTTVYFQYGLTTSYGSNTPMQTRTGYTVRTVSANISGLTVSTTYHFRIVAHNGGGTAYGGDRTFTTLSATGPPVVATNPATLIASFSATLNGSVDPHGLSTTVYFQYGTTTSYGHTTANQSKTGNTYQNVIANISGLTASTTYHFRIVATNSGGTRYGADRTFTTLSATGPPVAITNPATLIASFSARLNGSVDPHGLTTTVYFQYGTTTSYGSNTGSQTKTGNTYQNVAASISGLNASTIYHFRIVATNRAGTTYGADRTFTTLSTTGPPVAITNPATNVMSSSATLNGSVDPHGLTTRVYFQYGATSNYGHTTANQTKTGNTYQNVSANISGLTASTTYHFRFVATNTSGTMYGSDRTFTTTP